MAIKELPWEQDQNLNPKDLQLELKVSDFQLVFYSITNIILPRQNPSHQVSSCPRLL